MLYFHVPRMHKLIMEIIYKINPRSQHALQRYMERKTERNSKD